MRAFRIAFLTAAATLTASAFAAGPSPLEGGGTVQVVRSAASAQTIEIDGAYALSNGGILQITTVDGNRYASLNDGDRYEIVPTGDSTFSTKDNSISLIYKPQGSGEEISLSYSNGRAPAKPRRHSIRERGTLWTSP